MPPPPPRDDTGRGVGFAVRDLVREYTQPSLTSDFVRRGLLESAARQFVSQLAFTLDIPGEHYSGLSNQHLFDILAAQGRDFGARSRELDEHVRVELIREFSDYPYVPSSTLFRQVTGDIIAEWVVARMEGTIRDVPIRPLAAPTLAFKRKHGFDHRVGIMRGDLLESVKSMGVRVQ
jgi:hypothetical protein